MAGSCGTARPPRRTRSPARSVKSIGPRKIGSSTNVQTSGASRTRKAAAQRRWQEIDEVFPTQRRKKELRGPSSAATSNHTRTSKRLEEPSRSPRPQPHRVHRQRPRHPNARRRPEPSRGAGEVALGRHPEHEGRQGPRHHPTTPRLDAARIGKLNHLLAARTEKSALALRRLTGAITLSPQKPEVGRPYVARCKFDALNPQVEEVRIDCVVVAPGIENERGRRACTTSRRGGMIRPEGGPLRRRSGGTWSC